MAEARAHTAPAPPGFYVTGGTLARESPCYVAREADSFLEQGLLAGELCYILTSRQMGKSSLMVRTAGRLRDLGVAVATVDLTAFGQMLNAEQWYDAFLSRIGAQLDLEEPLERWWLSHERLPPLARFTRALCEVVLVRRSGPVVVMIDEIDTVLSLPFPCDEFFAAIRELHNRRVEDPVLRRLTFCLVGVVTPSDLIRDTRTTPFNVGRRIDLGDFTAAEAAPLAAGLGPEERRSRALLGRVLHWTGGHPYLTQRLCQAVAEDGGTAVDLRARELFLSPGSRERDTNLLFVQERLLRGEESDVATRLEFYGRVRRGERLSDAEQDPHLSLLRLSGLLVSSNGLLRVRNRIYRASFDEKWVRSSLPGAELRRQRQAYRRGLLRAASLTSVVVLIVAALGLVALDRGRRAETSERRYRQLLYAAQMNMAWRAWDSGDLARVIELLEGQRPGPGEPDLRGFEWSCLWRLSHGELRAFPGGPVLAFTPDGTGIATVSSDQRVRLWDLASGQERPPAALGVRLRSDRNGEGGGMAFRPGFPQSLAIAAVDDTVRIWDFALSRATARLASKANGLAYAPSSGLLALTSQQPPLTLWDRRGLSSRVLRGHTGGGLAVAFSGNGRLLASGSADRSVRLWDPEAGRELAVLWPDVGWVHGVALSPDGKRLAASGSRAGRVVTWDVATRRETGTLAGHRGAVVELAYSPDGTLLASASTDATARLWDSSTGAELATLRGHTQAVWRVSFSPDGSLLATGGNDRTVKVWDVARELRRSGPLARLAGPASAAAVSPGAALCAVALPDFTIHVIEPASGREMAVLGGHTDVTKSVSFSPDGQRVVSASGDGTLRIWEASTGRELARLAGHVGAVDSATFVSDAVVASGGSDEGFWLQGGDRTVRLWDAASGQEISRLGEHGRAVISLAASPDRRHLASADADGSAILWDLGTRRLRARIRGTAVLFTPDSQHLVSASEEGTRLWDLDGRELARFRSARPLAWSQDGRRLVTGAVDGSLELWDLETFQPLGVLPARGDAVLAGGFSPDGSTLFAVGRDGALRAWPDHTGPLREQ